MVFVTMIAVIIEWRIIVRGIDVWIIIVRAVIAEWAIERIVVA
jgi:hypothetical protein